MNLWVRYGGNVEVLRDTSARSILGQCHVHAIDGCGCKKGFGWRRGPQSLFALPRMLLIGAKNFIT